MRDIDYEALAGALDAAANALRRSSRVAGRPERSLSLDAAADEGQRTLLLKVEEAASELRVSRSVVYEHIRTGRLASVQIGRSRRIRRDALLAFIGELSS